MRPKIGLAEVDDPCARDAVHSLRDSDRICAADGTLATGPDRRCGTSRFAVVIEIRVTFSLLLRFGG
jgi:hypothetical protein